MNLHETYYEAYLFIKIICQILHNILFSISTENWITDYAILITFLYMYLDSVFWSMIKFASEVYSYIQTMKLVFRFVVLWSYFI